MTQRLDLGVSIKLAYWPFFGSRFGWRTPRRDIAPAPPSWDAVWFQNRRLRKLGC